MRKKGDVSLGPPTVEVCLILYGMALWMGVHVKFLRGGLSSGKAEREGSKNALRARVCALSQGISFRVNRASLKSGSDWLKGVAGKGR